MAGFTPENPLEEILLKLVSGEDDRIAEFFDVLPAARLAVIIRSYPERVGTDLIAPPGENPDIAVFNGSQGRVISFYTAQVRVQEAFDFFELSRQPLTWVWAQGSKLLPWLYYGKVARGGQAEDVEITANYGSDGSFYGAGTRNIGLMLQRLAGPQGIQMFSQDPFDSYGG